MTTHARRASAPVSYAVVIPTVGRPTLDAVLRALAASRGPSPEQVVVVDDRRDVPAGDTLGTRVAVAAGNLPVQLVRGPGRGPAAARNAGWRRVRAAWVAFLDDDVVPQDVWRAALADDLARLGADVGGSQALVDVPLPTDRRPTDWERSTAGLASSAWITADMAYRREVLSAVGGFDERFPRAYREDADLALRVLDAGHRLVRGSRRTAHPVRPADRWVSVRMQAGNASDPLMRALHGADWRVRAEAPRGRRPWHLAVTAAAALAVTAGVARRPRVAMAAGLGWAAGTADFARRRIAPGPRTGAEIATMLLTSAVIPPVATAHWLRGVVAFRGARPWAPPPEAVLLDRDGTLVLDVPYNGDPALVRPVPGAREAVDRLRVAGVRLGVVTNQSGVARGLLTRAQVDAVNARVEELLGPFETWQVCVHAPDDGCGCRKPAPGMVKRAAEVLGVPVERCAVVGDIGADVEAARVAGARSVLVPTRATRAEEVAAAPLVAAHLGAAVDLLLRGGLS